MNPTERTSRAAALRRRRIAAKQRRDEKPTWTPAALDAFAATTEQAMEMARVTALAMARIEGTR